MGSSEQLPVSGDDETPTSGIVIDSPGLGDAIMQSLEPGKSYQLSDAINKVVDTLTGSTAI